MNCNIGGGSSCRCGGMGCDSGQTGGAVIAQLDQARWGVVCVRNVIGRFPVQIPELALGP